MDEGVDLGSRHLVASRGAGVLRVRLDRPERRNACTMAMYDGLRRAARLAGADPSCDCLLITGTGDSFCVGGDMGGDAQEDAARLAADADPIDMIPFPALERCPKIVVVAVNGLCHAGGCDMVLCSDISIASDRATFRVPELLRGIADSWLGARLPQRVGMARAKRLVFTGETIDAAEAERIGLVSQVVPHAQLEAAAEACVEAVKRMAPRARGALKAQINRQLPPFDVGLFVESIAGEEVREGFRAFLEKRPPSWPRGG